MYIEVDWSFREAHMYSKHGVTTAQAGEALEDPNRVVIEPDYASLTGDSVRVIGYVPSLDTILTVLLVVDPATERVYGASGWESNIKDRNIYYRKGENNDQDL